MRRYLLDSGIVSDWIDRRNSVDRRVAEALRRGDRIGIGTPVIGELWGGVEFSNTSERNRTSLARAVSRVTRWVFDEHAAREYGRLYADLRRRGRIIPQIDLQIAAIALSLGNCTVVTKDSDFQAIAGLDVEDWSKP